MTTTFFTLSLLKNGNNTEHFYAVYKNGDIFRYFPKKTAPNNIGHMRVPSVLHAKDFKKTGRFYYGIWNTSWQRVVAFAYGLLESVDYTVDNRDVNHKDGNRLNNAVSNLEALAHKDNCQKKVHRMLYYAIDIVTGESSEAYNSGSDFCAAYNIPLGNIGLWRANINEGKARTFEYEGRKYIFNYIKR